MTHIPMIDLTVTYDGNLYISPEDDVELQDCESLEEAFDYHTSNGWTFVPPEDIGALTSGHIITRDADIGDDGRVTPTGTVYWDTGYQLRCTLERLKQGLGTLWTGVPLELDR